MERARPCDRIFDQIRTMAIGDVLLYADLEAILGRKVAGSAGTRGPIYAAIRRAEKECLRSLDCVPQVGYRMVEAREHETLARRHHAKSVKQMRRSWQRLHSADRALLSHEECQRIDTLEVTVGRQQQAIRSLQAWRARTDQVLDVVRGQAEQAVQSSDEMSERMARMEAANSELREALARVAG